LEVTAGQTIYGFITLAEPAARSTSVQFFLPGATRPIGSAVIPRNATQPRAGRGRSYPIEIKILPVEADTTLAIRATVRGASSSDPDSTKTITLLVHPQMSTRLITGMASGEQPSIRGFTVGGRSSGLSFVADRTISGGGVRVAVADVNGDGVADVVTSGGPGASAFVVVYDGKTGREVDSFPAYGGNFRGGVNVAAGDLDGDGRAEIVVGPGAGRLPEVRVFRFGRQRPVESFMALDPAFRGGVSVAVGDLNGDGQAEIVTGAGPGGEARVTVFSGREPRPLLSFFASDPAFRGGVSVATGDLNGDGRDEIVAGAGPGGGPRVNVFSGATGASLESFVAYEPEFTGGVNVAAGDLDGDGKAEIVTAPGAGGGPRVRVFDGATFAEAYSFFAYEADYRGGVSVAVVH
jgi:hypothetical protein